MRKPSPSSQTRSISVLSAGCAVLWAIVASSIASIPADAAAPVVAEPPIYRTYPDFPITVVLDVSDPEDDPFTLVATDLPVGSSFDPGTGTFSWTPAEGDEGLYYILVTATDNEVPPLEGSATLTLQVSATDACFQLTCDPATGCSESLPPVDQDCCSAEPSERVPEPDASCPEGRALIVGRNNVSFGQMHNCDLLGVNFRPQGGTDFQVNIAGRCFNTDELASVRVLLETADYYYAEGDPGSDPLSDTTTEYSPTDWTERPDGFFQLLGETFFVQGGLLSSDINGVEADLTVTLTDFDGVEVEEKIRLTLSTAEVLADIPEPDAEDIIPGEAGCVGCHRPLVSPGVREGIEDSHPYGAVPLSCIDCHGGDGGASTKEDAHVPAPGGPAQAFIRKLSSDELDVLDPEYLQFINPGDLRVAPLTCGTSGCHESHTETVPRSTMSTYAGHYTLSRFLIGAQGRDPIYAAVDVTDPDFDAGSAPEGAIESLAALREPAPEADRSDPATLQDIYLPKSCPTCHLSSFGRNESKGAYRSSGCTACHMVYDDDGRSQSEDPVVNKFFPPHPIKHVLTKAIPTEQCAHCHFQGGRIGLNYRGIREGGFDEANTPPNAVPLGKALYGHPPDFYFTDEDDTNGYDETPPDLHHDAGMVCADCHVGGDVHGDDHLYQSERYQVGILCEDCHGTVRATIEEDVSDGLFKNAKGDPLRNLRRDAQDRIYLQLSNAPEELLVPQIKTLLDFNINQDMTDAMGVHDGFSHTDSLECYTCHTSWQMACFGCHVTLDDRLSSQNHTTGQISQGAAQASRDTYQTEHFSLGLNHRGKVTPLCSSMSMFLSYIDDEGTTLYSDQVRQTQEGVKGFGWNPFHFHTVTKAAKTCDNCHPTNNWATPPNQTVLDRTYGFGDRSVMIEDGDGTLHDVTQFLSPEGDLIGGFAHPDTGPIPDEMRERALSVPVPEPADAVLALVAIVALSILTRRRASTR